MLCLFVLICEMAYFIETAAICILCDFLVIFFCLIIIKENFSNVWHPVKSIFSETFLRYSYWIMECCNWTMLNNRNGTNCWCKQGSLFCIHDVQMYRSVVQDFVCNLCCQLYICSQTKNNVRTLLIEKQYIPRHAFNNKGKKCCLYVCVCTLISWIFILYFFDL